MSNLNLQKLREWVWPWPWTFSSTKFERNSIRTLFGYGEYAACLTGWSLSGLIASRDDKPICAARLQIMYGVHHRADASIGSYDYNIKTILSYLLSLYLCLYHSYFCLTEEKFCRDSHESSSPFWMLWAGEVDIQVSQMAGSSNSQRL